MKRPVQPSSFDDFDRFFDRFSRHLSELGWSESGEVGGPAIDVAVYDDKVFVAADLAGYIRSNVHVAVGEGMLLLRAERGSDPFRSAFVREISLPAGLDVEAADATFNNGVLTVTFPVAGGNTGDATVVDVQ